MTDLTRRKKELLNSYNNLCSCYGDIISEQTKTINQLKELLKECKSSVLFEADVMKETSGKHSKDYKMLASILTKIDEMIK